MLINSDEYQCTNACTIFIHQIAHKLYDTDQNRMQPHKNHGND